MPNDIDELIQVVQWIARVEIGDFGENIVHFASSRRIARTGLASAAAIFLLSGDAPARRRPAESCGPNHERNDPAGGR